MYCWAPNHHSVPGVVQQWFPFLSPLAGFLLVPCSFLLGFIAARIPLLIHVLLALHLCKGTGSPASCSPLCTAARHFLAKVQVFALVEFHEVPASEFFHLTRWSCPQVYQLFLPKFNVILKTDKDAFCLHLLLLRKNIRQISSFLYRPLNSFTFNQPPVSLTTELQLLSSMP